MLWILHTHEFTLIKAEIWDSPSPIIRRRCETSNLHWTHIGLCTRVSAKGISVASEVLQVAESMHNDVVAEVDASSLSVA